MTVLGVGTDVVYIPTFSEQLGLPGSRLKEVFTAHERRRAKQRATEWESVENKFENIQGENRHLAAVWAMKEAFIKAWSGALSGIAPPLSNAEVKWPEIEVRHDLWGRPRIALSGAIRNWVAQTLGHSAALEKVDSLAVDVFDGVSADQLDQITWHVSASHDGDIACALVVLERGAS